MQNTTYLTDRQIAARLGVSRATIWNWAKSGILPKPRKIGPNITRWASDEIERHMAERAG